jgi:uncharacterized membrane protein
MAGIGFELRKLLRQDDLLGIVRGYGHSALTATGPWLLTIVMLGAIVFLGSPYAPPRVLAEFRLIVIYNFAFSLVLAGPAVMVATRYLADAIFVKQVEDVTALLLGYLTLLLVVSAPLVVPFYFFWADIDDTLALISTVNFFTITAIWIASTFLTALKDYASVTRAFLLGTVFAIGSVAVLARIGSAAAMMSGFTAGLALILFLVLARIYAEYPYAASRPFRFFGYFRRYWELALSGFVYNAAIWVDKWIMWLAPEAEMQPSGLISYPDYDSAMFLAYLSIVPSIAAFVLSVETDFYESYVRFYKRIQHHASLGEIEQAHRDIVASVLRGARMFVVLQGSICVVAILMAPQLFTALGINFAQIGMFRIGVLAAFFHVLALALSITLSYFDLRKTALRLQMLFLATNALFTWWTLQLGFSYYGYGYFLSALTTFVATFLAVAHYLNRLPYQTFVAGNASVRQPGRRIPSRAEG